MSRQRSGLPEVASVEGAWMRAPTLPAEIASRNGAHGETDWQHYWGAVRRRKWTVLAVILLGTALGLFASRLLHPPYSATALLWFETKDRAAAARDPRTASEADELLNPSGWIDLVQSNAVLEEVVRQRRLYLSPRDPADSSALATLRLDPTPVPGSYRYAVDREGRTFTLQKDGRVVQTDSLAIPAGQGLGFSWSPPRGLVAPGHAVDFTLNTPADAARQLRKTLSVTTDVDPALMRAGTDANFLRIQVTGSRPTELAATVNAIADRVVVVAADLKRIKLVELGRILDEQRQHALRNLRDAESAQRDFRVRSAGVLRQGAPPVSATLRGGGDPVFERSFDTKLALDSVQRDRQSLQRALAQMGDSGPPVEALQAIGAVQKSAELSLALQELAQKQATLRALRYRYTDASDPVQRARADVHTLQRSTIPALARGLETDLAAREEQLGRRADAAFGYLHNLPPLALEEARLQRDVAIAEQLFTTVQQSYNQTQLAAVSTLPDVRILDRATAPDRPDRNWTPLFACASFVVSLGLAVFGVVVLDGLDHKVRYPEHVTHHMRLSILGAVPRFDWRHLGNGKTAEAAAPVVEALRGLRLRLSHAGGSGPLLVTVTSPGVGEGKSFLSCNLALAFADAGYRTLLIDGDVRRGGQHRMLGVHREPGLVDFLAGEFPFETVVQATRHPGLSFIGCGARRPTAPELLSSDVMTDLIDRVRAECGVVLVDSPPLAVGVDPYVLATRTGNVLVVLRAGVSDLDLAAAKLDVLDALPVRVLGAVLNDVRPYGAYRYYTYDAAAYAEDNGAAGRRRSASAGVLWGRS
jgi:capsular exopolysaccharide synthesis family protein